MMSEDLGEMLDLILKVIQHSIYSIACSLLKDHYPECCASE